MAMLLYPFSQAFRKLNKGMAKLADESQAFENHTVAGLLRGAPDLIPNINNVEAMFQPTTEDSAYCSIFIINFF